MDLKDIGEAVQALRLAKGLNVREAGALTEMPVGFGMLNAIENGGNTSLKTLDGIVRALGGDLEIRIAPAPPFQYPSPPDSRMVVAEGPASTSVDLFAVAHRTINVLPRLKPHELSALLELVAQLEQGSPGQRH